MRLRISLRGLEPPTSRSMLDELTWLSTRLLAAESLGRGRGRLELEVEAQILAFDRVVFGLPVLRRVSDLLQVFADIWVDLQRATLERICSSVAEKPVAKVPGRQGR